MDRQAIKPESLIEGIIDTAHDMIYVIDLQGDFLYCNKAFEGLFKKYFDGKSPIGCNYFTSIAPAYREDRKALYDKHIKMKNEVGTVRITTEFHGHYFDNTAHYLDVDGNGFIIVYSRDITEHKRLENLYSRHRQLLDIAFNSMDDILLVVNADYMVELANESAARFINRQVSDLTLSPVFTALPYLERVDLKETIDYIINVKTTFTSKQRITNNGHTHVIETRASPIIYDDSSVSVLLVLRDITAKANLEHRILEVLVSKLSAKEQEVFAMIGQNKQLKTIAAELELSEGTVSSIKCRIKKKLNLQDQLEVQKVATAYLR